MNFQSNMRDKLIKKSGLGPQPKILRTSLAINNIGSMI